MNFDRTARFLGALASQIRAGTYMDAKVREDSHYIAEDMGDGQVMFHHTGERVITLTLRERRYFIPQRKEKTEDATSREGTAPD